MKGQPTAVFPQYWWREYRRERYRPRTRLGAELVCRRTLRVCLREFSQNCSLPGVRKLCEDSMTRKRRLFWLVIMGIVTVTLSYCLSSIWSGLSKPLVVSMESTTFDIGEIDFPAVALCNVNRVSRSQSAMVAKVVFDEFEEDSIISKNYSIAQFIWIMQQTGRFIDFEFNELFEEILNFFDVQDLVNFDTERITPVMRMISPDCSKMLVKCAWAGHVVPCDQLFETRRTIRGHCCTFNYVLEQNGSDGTVAEVKRQTVQGHINGLTVIMDPEIDDYAYPLHPMFGVEVLLFDPLHFADFSGGRVVHRFVEVNKGNLLELHSRTQVATDEVRKYSPQTRNCLFHDEQKNYGAKYSMSSCIIKCRIDAMQALCKCTPYFLPVSGGPVCSIDYVHCLNKYREKFLYLYPQNPETWDGLEREIADSINCPQCLPDCEHTQHRTTENKISLTNFNESMQKYFRGSFMSGVNLTNKCLISIYQPSSDGTLDRLDVVFYWFEILSK